MIITACVDYLTLIVLCCVVMMQLCELCFVFVNIRVMEVIDVC